jgi:hypothetical protein
VFEALKLFAVTGNPKIECITLEEGPFGIESQADVDSVALPLMRMVKQRSDVDAFIIDVILIRAFMSAERRLTNRYLAFRNVEY